MKKISPKHRILDHINNVRDWLNRAEGDYQAGASLRGEMNLNLAQAELKKAWEESRKLQQEAQNAAKVVPLPSAGAPQPAIPNKRRVTLVQRRFGLVAAVVLLLLINLAPLLRGLPLGQTLPDDANPKNKSPLVAEQQFSEGITFEPTPAVGSFTVNAPEQTHPDQTATGRSAAAADQRKGQDAAANQTGIRLNTGTTAAGKTDGTAVASTRVSDARMSFRFDEQRGQTAQTPVKEVKSEAKSPTPINRSIALNTRSLRSSGNRVDTMFTSGTTGSVKTATDSTPTRAAGSGLAITATDVANNIETRTDDTQAVNLTLSRVAAAAESVNVNTAYRYMSYSSSSMGSSSQNTVSGSTVKSGVKSTSAASSAAVVTFDFDTLVDLATNALYSNQH